MSIYKFFSARTKLPVAINEIRDYILEKGVVDRIEFCRVDIDSNHLRGVSRLYVDLGPIPRPYCEADPAKARIYFCHTMAMAEQRFAVAKELVHILDRKKESAQTRDQVSNLIDEIAMPISSAALLEIGLPTWSDHLGEVRALAVLLPIATVRICRKHVTDGFMSPADVAALAHIPERYSSFMLQDKWEEIIAAIEADGDRTTKRPPVKIVKGGKR